MSTEEGRTPRGAGMPQAEFSTAEIDGELIKTLKADLNSTRARLQAKVDELQKSNAKLQGTFDKLLAANDELHTANAECQRKIDEQALRIADMDQLMVTARVGVIYLDRDLRILEFTPVAAHFFNLLPRHLGRTLDQISIHAKIEELLDDIKRVLATGDQREHIVQGGDGSFLMRVLPYRDHAGSSRGVALTFIEITELKKADERVRQTGERYYKLFEESSSGLVKVAENGSIVKVNRAALKMFGYERQEMIGKPVEMLVRRSSRVMHVKLREAFFVNPHSRTMSQGREVVAVRKDGSEIFVDVSLTSIDTPDGPHVLASIVDITRRKRLESQKDRLLEVALATSDSNLDMVADSRPPVMLRGSISPATSLASAAAFEEALHLFMRQARLAIGTHQAAVTYIPDGDFSGTYYHTHSFSTKYEKYNINELRPTDAGICKLVMATKLPICLTQEQILAHPDWRNLLHREDAPGQEHPPLRGCLAVPILSGESGKFLGILQLSDKCDGDFTVDDLLMATRLTQLMAPTFALQYVNDRVNGIVAERTRELACANEALARSNGELESFAYVASHDLQEPLRKIASYCQLLKEEQADTLNPTGIEYLDIAINGAKRLRVLIRDLLAFSRITTRGHTLAATDADKCVREAIGNLEMVIAERSALVSYDSLHPVMADAGQLTLLFQNLIGNAIKYCKEAVPTVHIGGKDVGPRFEFFVRDNGIGIDPQYHDRIFQIFQRLHGRAEYSGTGIGLAICKRVVERFGGRIWVQSSAGAGSTFFFVLNKAQTQEGGQYL